MKKGEEGGVLTTVISLLLSFEVFMFIVALVIVLWVLPLFFTNPCWKGVMAGYGPLAESISGVPQMVLDPRCVESVTFTSDMASCEVACNLHNDQGEIRSCTAKCKADVPEPKSFIVVIPRNYGLVGKTNKVLGGDGVMWMFNGKPEVFILNECQLDGFEIDDIRCQEVHSSFLDGWRCDIPDECAKEKNQNDRDKPRCHKSSYYLNIDSAGMSCSIEASSSRA